jgi:phage FluMu gp28-like protein
MYLGMDIGRKRDLSVLWLVERVGDVAWTRAVQVLERRPFAEQRGVLYRAMERHGVRRACIDSTGIGAQLAEEARERFGSRVEEVTFSGPVKEDLAITAKRAFEDRRVRVPRDEDVREDLHAVQRTVTRSGNVRLDAERSERGHADRFWALALALHAGSTPAAPVHYERVTPRRSFGTAPEDDEPRSSLRRPAVQGSGGRRAW